MAETSPMWKSSRAVEPIDLPSAGDRPVLKVLPRAVIVTDDAGVVTVWNRAAEELYGWSEHEAIGQPIVELLSIVEHKAMDHVDLEEVAAGATRAGDRWVRRRDDTVLLVRTATRPIHDEHGDVVAIVGVSEDVTEQRRTDTQLRELTQQLRTALDAGGLGTWRWDARAERVVWDEVLERLFGLSPGEFDGTFEQYMSLIHPDDRSAVLATVDEAMRSGERYRVDHRIIRPDGVVRWIRGSAAVMIDEQANPIGTVGCAADVTDEVEAARELQRLSEAATRAADSERIQRQRLEFVARVNDALADATSIRDVMRNVTRALVPDLGTWCSMFVFDDEDDPIPTVETWHTDPAMVRYARELQSRFPFDPDADQGPPAVIRDGRTDFVPEIDTGLLDALDLPEEIREVVERLGLSSSITVPLVKRDRVLGALQLVTAHDTRRFTADDVAVAEALASRVVATVDNIRLREAARATSMILQHSLLPAELPSVPGIELAVRYWPAGEGAVVGGDFYDVFETGPGHWAVVIGDVCGTGPHAASVTGLARHTARAAAWHGDAPDDVLRSVHRALRRSDFDTYLTAICGDLDLTGDEARLTLAVGGHPLPLVVHDGSVAPIGEHGTLLGFLDDVRLTATSHPLHTDDMVVLYTDGATDMRPPRTITPDEFAGLVGVAGSASSSATEMADLLGQEFDRIQPFDERNDDVAVMVLRLTECPPATSV